MVIIFQLQSLLQLLLLFSSYSYSCFLLLELTLWSWHD